MKKVERMGASHRGLHPKLLYGLILILGVVCLFEAHPALAASTCEGSRAYIPKSTTVPPTAADRGIGNQTEAQVKRGIGPKSPADDADNPAFLKRKAAEGSSQAEYVLGQYYLQQRDYRSGAYWIKRAVKHGCTAALLYMGLLTEHGSGGVSKNVSEGRQMIVTAAKGGDPAAQLWLGNSLYGTQPKTGFAWVKKAANAGFPPAELVFAAMFLDGKATKKNPRAAIVLLESVYSGNSSSSPMAAYILGGIYMKGLGGVPVDDSRAFKWMIIAANYRVPHAA
ncbi:MAG TPA: tetratricopeptide repeat protein, partial [Gammaproteobacteria bacterium]|nr:tetratricopeptide repeat protein [Gammaproteobacteria bacterium]